MAAYFSEEALRQLEGAFETVPSRSQDLAIAFIERKYRSDSAREYALHGVARRVFTVARCIDRIFDNLPPDLEHIPARETRIDASINLQAFVFNVFGILDNLAFVWVNEKKVRGRNGNPLPNGRVGLGPDKVQVRESFSSEGQTYFESLDKWFAYLEDFRHSLGHRIPLYIAPFIIDPRNEARYNELETLINEAHLRRDYAESDRLASEQLALAKFLPVMRHSLRDPSPGVVFHSQVLADFATVEEVASKVIEELDRPAGQ